MRGLEGSREVGGGELIRHVRERERGERGRSPAPLEIDKR